MLVDERKIIANTEQNKHPNNENAAKCHTFTAQPTSRRLSCIRQQDALGARHDHPQAGARLHPGVKISNRLWFQ